MDINDYKGYFVENDEANEEPKYFEFGAHFSYKELYNVLMVLKQKQLKIEKGKKIEKILQINKKKTSNKERNNTRNKNNENENNLNQIINKFKFKGKTRNIENNEQTELTFIPKNNFNNYFSLKKTPQNNSTNNYKTNQFNPGKINYLKIYKNKINNIKLNETQFGKFSQKYLSTKKKQNYFINQRMKLFKTKNKKENYKIEKSSNDISLQKSLQTQIHRVKKNAKKNLKLNFLPHFSNSKSSIEKGNKSYKKEKITTELKRIQFLNKKEIKKSKAINNLLSNNKSKMNNQFTEYKNNSSNILKIKEAIETKKAKILPIKTHINIKLDNNYYKTNDNSKPIISVSIDNNDIEVLNHKINGIKNMTNLNGGFIKEKKFGIKKEKNKKKPDSMKNQESLNILFNSKEKNSRNKINDLMKNISLINFSENKSMFNNLSKINSTQQSINYFQKIGLNKKNKNFISNKNNNKNLIIGMPSYSNSNKKKYFPSQLYNNITSNNYYNNKINNIYMNSLILNDSNKTISIKRIKLNKNLKQKLTKKSALKNIILKTNPKVEKINNEKKNMIKSISNSELLNDKAKRGFSKGASKEKKYQNLINNNDNNKNNINININISNNNSNIIYNNDFNNISKNKNYSRINTQKSLNSLEKNKNIKMKNNIKSRNIEFKNKNTTQNKNKTNKDNTKVKLINIQFPKAKFINIFNSGKKNI